MSKFQMTKNFKFALSWGLPAIALTGMIWTFFRSANELPPDPAPIKLPAIPDKYDVNASIEKLKKIGAALQLYREEYGVMAVAGRSSMSDAGLPVGNLERVLTTAGAKWSVPSEQYWPPLWSDPFSHDHRYQFVPESPERIRYFIRIPVLGWPLEPQWVALDNREFLLKNDLVVALYRDELRSALTKRGEDLPVLIDFVPRTGKAFADADDPVEVVILRLGGKVDVQKLKTTSLRKIALFH